VLVLGQVLVLGLVPGLVLGQVLVQVPVRVRVLVPVRDPVLVLVSRVQVLVWFSHKDYHQVTAYYHEFMKRGNN
jgi:hypothetical protein